MGTAVITNFKLKSKEFKKYANKMSKTILKDALFASLDHVGQIAVKDYMVPTSQEGAIGDASSKSVATIRSGRLAGSIVGNWRFSKVNLPKSVQRYMENKVSSSGQEFGSGKLESIRKVSVAPGRFEGEIGSKVEYAKVIEEGGVVHPTVTARARRFFWAMYMETGETKWKRMALTHKERFDVKIKARPFLKPAVKSSRKAMLNIFKESIESTWRRENI